MTPALRRLALSALACLVLAPGASAWTYRAEQTTTADGVTLRFVHLANPGRIPCVLVHGIASNLAEWNVPGRSFAAYLADHGYDVWCVNLRHAGHAPFQSDGDGRHSFDDLVVLDVPAIVSAVRAATGQRPFLVGHSLGGMVTLAWLQGVRRASVPVGLGLSTHGLTIERGDRIEADPALAAQRAGQVRGIVALAAPARFTWPLNPPPARATTSGYWDMNLLLEYLAWSPDANVASLLVPVVPGRQVIDVLTDDVTSFPFVGAPIRGYLGRVTRDIGRTYLVAEIMRPGSVDASTLYDALDIAVDDAPVGILRQFMDGIRTGDMREAEVEDPLRRPYSYADGASRVRAPLLWVAGREDKLANDDAIAATFRTVGSPDKTLLETDHGHVDLVIGDAAPQDVWSPVLGWLAAR
jgi:pimeloyl-ACP methyl ester carboxylesterase